MNPDHAQNVPPVRRLGPATHPSPLSGPGLRFVDDEERVLVDVDDARVRNAIESGRPLQSFERAGPRARLFFEPGRVTAGIVTCGGLCPGLNNVIRGLVLTLWHHYGCRRVLGFRYGYEGMSSNRVEDPLELDPARVASIHEHGGTILGTSRGPQDLDDMAAVLDTFGVDVLFAIGGDGTLRGAAALDAHLAERGRPVAVVGVPKTIDNDLNYVSRSFGFTTAVEAADRVLTGAHAEAEAARNGVGLVRLMGRHSGFIAANATLASADVNFCLVPEFPVAVDGPHGLLAAIRRRLEQRRHALIAVAEGWGQDLLRDADVGRDASGNRKLVDCGTWLRDRIRADFAARDEHVDIKYIDPSYVIRSVPANSFDAEYCLALAHHAVHAAMGGRTGILVGQWNQAFTHVPIDLAVSEPCRIAAEDPLWQRVLESTGQARLFAG